MSELVSVIVPFYNAQNYLKRCLTSIVRQTYDNLEIILVNNDSSDNSYQIAKQFEEDERIRLVTCKDRGVSYSRNMGINLASGKWLLFVDADDYIETDMIQNMVDTAEKHGNSIWCVEIGFYDETADGTVTACNHNHASDKIFGKEEMMAELFGTTVSHYQGYLWNKLLLRQLVSDNNIKFDTDIYYNEDRLFLLKYFLAFEKRAKVYYVSKAGYHYIHHGDSAMGKIKQQPASKVITEITAFGRMADLLKGDMRYREILSKLEIESTNSAFILLTKRDFRGAEKEKRFIRKYLKQHKAKKMKYRIKTFICNHDSLLMLFRIKNR